uniref:Ribosomal protein S14 n=1 Tax=Rhodomonas salina TaxID=3034 RepID=Q9G8W4_RHDSA|nr:ribosomal protein S14 [Rhodomonas salina]AAG17733.1 ribosomal protein S14 [Rhodomonas salina]
MRKQRIKDIKNRVLFKKREIDQIEINLISKLREKNFLFRLEGNRKFKGGSRIVNRCILSNRKKCIHKKFRISRIMLRNTVINGLILGLKKASF